LLTLRAILQLGGLEKELITPHHKIPTCYTMTKKIKKTGCIWLRIGTSSRLCKHSNEPSGSIKGRVLLD
jgi:hypothetical protein